MNNYTKTQFRVFQAENDEIAKGNFLLDCDGNLYETKLGMIIKVKNPEKYEVRFIAEQVD